MRLLNTKGFSLLEALMMVGSLGLLGMAVVDFQMFSYRNINRQKYGKQLELMRSMLYSSLEHPAVWQSVIADQDNLFVLCEAPKYVTKKTGKVLVYPTIDPSAPTDKSSCPYQTATSLRIPPTSADSLPIVNTTSPQHGFDMNLQPCTSFTGSDSSCPFRAEVKWTPICHSDSHRCTQAKVAVAFKANQDLMQAAGVNPSQYDFQLSKNAELGQEVIPPTQRSLSVPVTTTTTASVPGSELKVFLIVDNSVSMKDNLEQMVKSLGTFVDSLKGNDVSYYIYTTDSLHKINDAYPFMNQKLSPTKAFGLASGTFKFTNGVTVERAFPWADYNTSDYFKQGLTKPDFEGTIALAKDYAEQNGGRLIQKATHGASQLSSLKSRIVQLVTDMPTGSSDESGLCTLKRILRAQGSVAPVKTGDKALFVVMSDEDDAVRAYQHACSEKLVEDNEYIATGSVGTGVCNPATQSCTFFNARFPKKINRSYGTISATGRSVDKVVQTKGGHCFGYDLSCGPVGSRPCNEAERNQMMSMGSMKGLNLESCIYTASAKIDIESQVVKIHENQVQGFSDSVNYCSSSLQIGGVSYSNVVDYLVKTNQFPAGADSSSCSTSWGMEIASSGYVRSDRTIKIYDSNQILTDYSVPLRGALPMDGAVDIGLNALMNIPSDLDKMFGQDGYALFSVIHDEKLDKAAGCSMGSSSGSIGKTYKQVQLATNYPNNVYSICDASYKAPVERMIMIAKQMISNSIEVTSFDPGVEEIMGISIQRNSEAIQVSKSDYQVVGTNLILKPGLLVAGDLIKIQLESLQ